MNDGIATAIESVERCIDDLYGQATMISDEYLAFVEQVEARCQGWDR